MRWIATLVVLCTVHVAHAFCGFYVAGSNQQMFNDATQVVLARKGTRTVLAMQNNYKGPPEAFAMVIPVPVVLHEADVKTLTADVFQHVEQMGAPRLVEYWEQDPCRQDYGYADEKSGAAKPSAMADPKKLDANKDLGVTIEAKFVVGEYQILILSAKDSTGLDTWLRDQKYTIPAGAEPLLRPYVEQGMKFFVAKVDPAKVKWVGTGNDKRAVLSPLRFHYDSEDFALPIRLGLANSQGKQDLIVNILAPSKRYEVTNYKNVMIPTNIDVSEQMKDKFGSFYAALFDRTIEKNPGAVVTEYAWQATSCDPCPGPTLNMQELATLGIDVLEGPRDKPTAYQGYDLVLTRLHARYGKDITDDLRFREAQPIAGGREFLTTNGKLEEGWVPNPINNFQGRYAIRHPWTGPMKCDKPQRGIWGGPPADVMNKPDYIATGIKPAMDIAYAPRGGIDLPKVVKRDVPELELKAVAAPAAPEPATPPTAPRAKPSKKASGCGCTTNDAGGFVIVLFGLAFVLRGTSRRRVTS